MKAKARLSLKKATSTAEAGSHTSYDEAIHSIVDIMYAGVAYTVLERAIHAHPTVSELLPTVLGSLHPLEGGAGPAR